MKPEQTHNIRQKLIVLLTAALLSTRVIAADAPQASSVPASAVFAKVGDTVIFQQEFDAAYAGAMHKKFFHGKVPEGGAAALQREVGDKLVTNTLLLKEAKRRGLKPDDPAISKTIQMFEQRYRDNKQWQQNRAQILPSLTKQLTEENLLTQLENAVRNAPFPSAKQIEDYYVAHTDKFTEPEQLRLSVILLKVDPSSSSLVWNKAYEQAQNLLKQLRAGSKFSELAKMHSDDASSANGGDMGYLHRGMLPQAAQDNIDKLKVDEISEPVKLLEGFVIFRLSDRKPPHLNKLESVLEHVRDLWLREQGELAWKSLITKLKQETPIQVDESRYLAIFTTTGSHAVKK